jgi:hypothetical protein
MSIANQQMVTGSQKSGFFSQINQHSELVSLGLGASVSGISALNGGRLWESVAIGSIPAVGLYSGLKIFNLFKKPSSQDLLEDGSSASEQARNLSKYKIGPLGASSLSLAAGLAFAGLAHLNKSNFCKYTSWVCIVPSLGFMAYKTRKNLSFAAQPTTEVAQPTKVGPIITKEKDPLRKHGVSSDSVDRKTVSTPKVQYLDGKWVISPEEIERYNSEMGYVIDIKSLEEYQQFIRDYSSFPCAPAERTILGGSQSGGRAALERQPSLSFGFSNPDVPIVPFSAEQAGKFLDLLRFGISHLPLFLEKLEFQTEDEFTDFYVATLHKRETTIKEMETKFQAWCQIKK